MLLETIDVDFSDEADALELYRQQDWTDGLPIIVPTSQRLATFLDASGFADRAEEELGIVTPSNRIATVQNVAVNALMAGCRPEHLGIILAATEGILRDEYVLATVSVTDNSATPMLIVNGPSRGTWGVNSGTNALGPGQHANGVLGRAVRLIIRNIGGARDGVETAWCGQPGKFTFCLAEAEEWSPFTPLHQSLGFDADQDVVTVAAIENIVNIVPNNNGDEPLHPAFFHHFTRVMQAIGTNINFSYGSPVVLLSPGHARRLHAEGYDRTRLQEELWEQSKVPLSDLPWGNLGIGDWTVQDDKVLNFAQPSDLLILVAGSKGQGAASMYLQPYCASLAVSVPVWTP